MKDDQCPDGLITLAGGAVEYVEKLHIDVLARTLWGEARGEGERGMQAVANVIANRVRISGEKGGFGGGIPLFRFARNRISFRVGTDLTLIIRS